MAGDAIALVLSIYLSQFIKLYAIYNERGLDIVLGKIIQEPVTLPILSIAAIQIFFFMTLNIYSKENLNKSLKSFTTIAFLLIFTGLMITTLQYIISEYTINKKIIVAHIPLSILIIFVWRLIYFKYLIKFLPQENIALLLHTKRSKKWETQLKKHLPHWVNIISVVYCDDLNPECSLYDLSHINSLSGLNNYGTLLVDCSAVKLSSSEVQWLLTKKYSGTTVLDLAMYYQELTGRVPLEHVNEQWFLNAYLFSSTHNIMYTRIKRVIDMLAACILIVLLSPVIIFVTLLIKLESKGPALYKQVRLGRYRIPFTCYKFRTMISDAESNTGPVWSIKNDSRVTRIGTFLRQSRLDEIPQLFNIIKGDMSFVGPRPIRAIFARKYAENIPFYWLRYDVQPGVTGWAQVHNCYAVPDALKAFEYELFYMRNMSLIMDIVIIYKTLQSFIFFKGK